MFWFFKSSKPFYFCGWPGMRKAVGRAQRACEIFRRLRNPLKNQSFAAEIFVFTHVFVFSAMKHWEKLLNRWNYELRLGFQRERNPQKMFENPALLESYLEPPNILRGKLSSAPHPDTNRNVTPIAATKNSTRVRDLRKTKKPRNSL